MTDPVTAAMVVAVLSPFLVKAGEKFAEEAGTALAGKVGQIYTAVKENFADDEYAGLTLLRLSEARIDAGRRAALESVLQEKLDADPRLKAQLSSLVHEARKLDKTGVFASGIRSVAIGGDVSSSIIHTGDVTRDRNE